MNKQMQIKKYTKFNIGAYSTCLIILFLSMGYALFNDSLTFEATGIIASPNQAKFNEIILSNEEPTLNNKHIISKKLNELFWKILFKFKIL